MKVITLTTDFGTGDDEAGVLKGVIWKIAPDAKIADLSHAVSPQNVLEGALLLGRIAHYFPAGTVHVAVVDPGVGTERRGIAARLGSQYFVGPDNGLVTQMLERAEQRGEPVEIVRLDQPQYWLPKVTHIFHGRDVFAPVAAHLVNGVALNELGTPMTDPIRKETPRPVRTGQSLQALVLYIDSFGNLGTNVHRDDLGDSEAIRVRIAGHEIDGLVKAFGDRPAGELIALIDSSNMLSISVVNGDAANLLAVQPGESFEILLNGGTR